MTKIHPGSIANSKMSYMKRNKEHKKYINNKLNILLLQNINNLQAQIKTFFVISKQKYFSRISPESPEYKY